MTPASANGRTPGGSRLARSEDSTSASPARRYVNEAYRQRICWAMTQLVCERGIESVTVTSIVSRAAVSRRTFYLLFDDRDACIDAVVEEAVALARARVALADGSRARWIDRVRAGLLAMLELFDEQPELAELCVMTAVAAPRAVRARRRQVFDELAAVLDDGRDESRAAQALSPMTAESVIGGALAIVHARLVRGERRPLVELLNPLMAVIVLPYLGAAAARKELSRPVVPSRSAARRRRSARGNPLDGLNVRLTYRTMRVMTAVAAQPGLSNVEVGQRAGITDQGQISKLLARLASLELVENTGAGHPSGLSNAWRLTPRGRRVAWTFRREVGASGETLTR